MPIGWAIAGGAAVGALGSILGGQEQASGQQAAANTQQNMFNTIVGQEQPFMQAGYGATTALSQLLGTSPATGKGGTAGTTGLPGGYLTQTFQPTMQQLENYPGYQFALKTGGQALTNSMTPGVGAVSGPALKSLMGFNQGLAGTQYQNAFNNFQTQQNNIFSRLSSIAGMGQNAASNTGTAGTQLGTGIAGAQAGIGASLGGATVGASNALAGIPMSMLLGQYLQGGGGGGGATTPQYFGGAPGAGT